MNRHRFNRDIRAWPMLALLLVVVVVAIGCVLWFMREAMRNERLAIREKLIEAYRGQLALVQARFSEDWKRWLAQLDVLPLNASGFASAVRAGAQSVIISNVYPSLTGERDANAYAELLAAESSKDAAARLRDRVNDYSNTLPSAQRRFIMHEMQRIDPGMKFPTLAAEELAARYLESNSPDILPVPSPHRRVVALFTTDGLRAKLSELIRDAEIKVAAPGEDTTTALVTEPLSEVPGWRLALSVDDRKVFDSEADRRVARYFTIGSVVIAAMAVLAFFIARGFGRQVTLARLKNDLVANVSHELKTPLTAMRALVDTLLDTQKLDEKTTREYLQLLATENARLSRLIENFLTFSRLERNKFKFKFGSVRPVEIVLSAVAAFGERSRSLESRVAENLPAMRADTDALVTALLNLLDNAWKYTGDTKHIVLRAEARNGHVSFSIADNGIGLSPGEAKRVFDRFYRSDQRLASGTSGCGLGLSIVQSIVEAHHGTVRVESEPGRGSTFTIEIPTS